MASGSLGRRTALTVGALVVLAIPAGVLRVLCVGNACEEAPPAAEIPFCSLPDETRDLISAGFREGRSPDVFPLTERTFDLRVPLVFDAPGIQGSIPEGTTLDQVAPTLAALIGIERPHPEVRSGDPLDISVPVPPKLAVVIVWGDVGSPSIRSGIPILHILRNHGVASHEASTGSWPPDPTSVLATIGTGGLPRQHGITGHVVRDDFGNLVAPGSPNAPVSIIATLGDDLDELTAGKARVGVTAGAETARVGIGGDWYLGGDKDDVTVGVESPSAVPHVARQALKRGYGKDDVPDLLLVVLGGRVTQMDAATGEVVRAARVADPNAVVVLTATGETATGPDQAIVDRLDERFGVPVLSSIDPWSRLFLDQKVLAREKIAVRDVVGALDDMFVDVFPATAIEFGRYC